MEDIIKKATELRSEFLLDNENNAECILCGNCSEKIVYTPFGAVCKDCADGHTPGQLVS